MEQAMQDLRRSLRRSPASEPPLGARQTREAAAAQPAWATWATLAVAVVACLALLMAASNLAAAARRLDRAALALAQAAAAR